jgi:transposase
VRDVDTAGCAVLVHCEAVTRPNMGFMPVKNLHQKAQLMVHRARQGSLTPQRTATINRIRGLDFAPPNRPVATDSL